MVKRYKSASIAEREAFRQESFTDTLDDLRKFVNVRKFTPWRSAAHSSTLESALRHTLHCIHAEPLTHLPEDADPGKVVSEALQSVGVMHREVKLERHWQRNAMGVMIAQRTDGTFVSLFPTVGGYRLYDYVEGTHCRVTAKKASELQERAFLLYPPLPRTELTKRDLGLFLARQLMPSDVVGIVAATLLATLLGFVLPAVIQILYSAIIPSSNESALVPLLGMLTCVPISLFLIRVVRGVLVSRVESRMGTCTYAAIMGRLLQLPASFFRAFDAGDLAKRVISAEALVGSFANTLFTVGLSAIFSVLYLFQISAFAPAFVAPTVVVALLALALAGVSAAVQVRYATKVNEGNIELSSDLYDYLSDVRKIKLSGSERLVFSRWMRTYIAAAEYRYARPFVLRMGTTLSETLMAAGTIAIYIIAVGAQTSVANFFAFTASFGLLIGALSMLLAVVQAFAQMAPDFKATLPILHALPEKNAIQKTLESFSGHVRFEHVTFRYEADEPPILDNLSLEIRPGQYVGIVGQSGSGKSTLIRLLLGFEHPERGTVYVEENNLAGLNLQSYRRNLGIVLQNSALMSGTVQENILMAAPWLDEESAWQAADIASIGDDIRMLPMGMKTMLSSSGAGVSGGQRQRLMIARAVAPKPTMLVFDEATSSLDNATQAAITDALNTLDCTRIVVAHRLSTVEQCDRIIVLEQGRIVEDGTYAELLERDAQFAHLVKRQQLS